MRLQLKINKSLTRIAVKAIDTCLAFWPHLELSVGCLILIQALLSYSVSAQATNSCQRIYPVFHSEEEQIHDLLEKARHSFPQIVNDFSEWAHFYHAEFSARIKSAESLADKPNIRKSNGQMYSYSQVRDTVGIRFILPLSSPLLRIQNDQDIALLLGIAPISQKALTAAWRPYHLLRMKIKGDQNDKENGKFYRATHLTIEDQHHLNFELQLMSKTVYDWQSWDHDIVYKPNSKTYIKKSPEFLNDLLAKLKTQPQSPQSRDAYVDRLNIYSQAWIRLIEAMEDIYLHKQSTSDLLTLIRFYLGDNQPIDLHDKHWLIQFDQKLIQTLSINTPDQFFHDNHGAGLNLRKQAIKDLIWLSSTVF